MDQQESCVQLCAIARTGQRRLSHGRSTLVCLGFAAMYESADGSSRSSEGRVRRRAVTRLLASWTGKRRHTIRPGELDDVRR
jgi:hypothetical protein